VPWLRSYLDGLEAGSVGGGTGKGARGGA
jgi:hypothetical protein